eukprot:3782973-Amphidinium_carterae.1
MLAWAHGAESDLWVSVTRDTCRPALQGTQYFSLTALAAVRPGQHSPSTYVTQRKCATER